MSRSASRIPLLVISIAVILTAACGGGGGGNSVVDNTPPTVTATDPPADAVGVQLADLIIATFSESIDPTSVIAASFQVTDDMGNPVNGTVSASGRRAQFNPDNNELVKATLYHAMLTTGIKDSAGNPLAADFNWTFSTTSDMWTPTSNTSPPTPRSDHTAVWTGTEMIVWGGVGSSGVVNTGARYNPSNPDATAWRPTADTTMPNVPLARTNHTAIWDDLHNEMIVWGGELGGALGPTNSGARYSPATDTWTSTAVNSLAPTARSNHTAVWTGSEMIVWGGTTAGGILTSSGGRFDPSGAAGAGTWTATSPSGPPSPRTGHTAIWTGSEMIVWGGDDGVLTPTGGRYRPATNSWTDVATVGAPSARTDHTAIWTGSEMIVWGGDDGLGAVATGARYNPATNSWSSISAVGAPSPRSGHEAIWTGTEMVIWGGSSNVPGDISGAAYNPAHDTWRPIAAPMGILSARTGHTAVWSGSKMIVWGGNDSVAPSSTGARYAP